MHVHRICEKFISKLQDAATMAYVYGVVLVVVIALATLLFASGDGGNLNVLGGVAVF
jgi:hypothetical protein